MTRGLSRTVLPGHIMLAAMIVALAMVLLVLVLASRQPWLGLRLSYDDEAEAVRVVAAHADLPIAAGTLVTRVAGAGREMTLQPRDFIMEPDGNLPTYTDYDDFLARQEALYIIQSSSLVILTDGSGGAHSITPQSQRPFSTLPPDYWVSLLVGVFAWLISAGVWSFRRQDPSARYLLLGGFATLMFAPLAAVYTTRELALPATLFRWLSDLNFFGGNLYVACLAAMLWYYPRPLGRINAGAFILIAFLSWFFLQQSGAISSMIVGRRLSVLIALVLTVVFAILQWRGTRRDPLGRAALQWFLLAWLTGVTLFSVVIFVPQLYGVDTGPLQGYSFLVFLLIYAGLALGILRYGLFGLGRWWSRILNWVLAVLVLICLDVLFMLGLQLSSGLSLGLALLICCVVWLPLRGWLWQRLVGARRHDGRDNFRQIVGIALAPAADVRSGRWRDLLQSSFDPLQMQAVEGIHEPGVADDGLHLLVPAVADCSPLRLEYAQRGQRLFGPHELQQLRELMDMLEYVNSSRDAYNRGASEERQRIARDLHDDVGAHLLNSLQQGEVTGVQQKVREAMEEIRTLVRGLTGDRLSLEEMIAQLRYEARQRLDGAAIELDWPVEECESKNTRLSYRQYKNFMSSLREIMSNVIRHANSTKVTVRLEVNDDGLALTVNDDGSGLPAGTGGGHGLANIHRRMEGVGGKVRFNPAASGTSITLAFPFDTLPDQA